MFSSVAAYEGPKGILFYSAAKAGVQSAVRAINKEFSMTQRINSISPGWVDTEMTNSYLNDSGMLQKNISPGYLGIGKPQDVSGIVLFLLSSRSENISGQDFVIDGGHLINI